MKFAIAYTYESWVSEELVYTYKISQVPQPKTEDDEERLPGGGDKDTEEDAWKMKMDESQFYVELGEDGSIILMIASAIRVYTLPIVAMAATLAVQS